MRHGSRHARRRPIERLQQRNAFAAELADERQLAGTPGATVSVVSPGGARVATVGKSLHIGLTAFGGSVPQPTDQADLAATSIGQGRVLVSPLGLAMVAAAADTGTVRAPRLVTGGASSSGASSSGASSSGASSSGASSSGASSSGGQATGQLPASVVGDLHEMMASVVARGTAAGQGLPSGTYGKTGTAEYGTSKLMGFKGNIAFAALVVNSAGDGGPTCGPIVARFLNGL